jgi:hypothetical protein
MADTPLQYEKMVQDAMRGVAREALREAESHGLPGEHHFYIGFKTGAPEVEMPNHLRAQYPEDITIIIQHQYWDLQVDEAGFSIGLAFGGKREQLYVPFAALTSFVDPSVEFGLQFAQPETAEDSAPKSAETPPPASEDSGEPPAPKDGEAPNAGKSEGKAGEKVVSLDQFRKK